MEETSSFYRRVRRVQTPVLRFAGLIPLEGRTHYFLVQSSPRYEIFLGIQIVCLLTVTQTSVCIDTSVAFLITIACGHFRLIQVRLNAIARDIEDNEEGRRLPMATVQEEIRDNDEKVGNLDFERSDEGIRKRVRHCVAYHGSWRDTRESFVTISSSCRARYSLISILLAGNMPLAEKFKFAPVLLILTTQLFVCQYPPDLLLLSNLLTSLVELPSHLWSVYAPDYLLYESEAVSTAAYSTADTLMKHRSSLGRLVVLVILRASRPVQMTAGGIVNLSMEYF